MKYADMYKNQKKQRILKSYSCVLNQKKEDIQKGYDVGADLYQTKPFSTKHLLTEIEKLKAQSNTNM